MPRADQGALAHYYAAKLIRFGLAVGVSLGLIAQSALADRLPSISDEVRVTSASLLNESNAISLRGELLPTPVDVWDEDSWIVPSNGWLDNVDAFLGLDGSKQPQDFGINAQFGGRASANVGIPIWGSLGIQIGTAIDATADAVQVMSRIEGSTGRTQSFTTVGLFQRTESGFMWGVAYDFLYENYYDSFTLGQWRLNLGYQLTERSTVGVWGTIPGSTANGEFLGIPVQLQAISQTNFYWRYEWTSGVYTTMWGGIAYEHSQANAVLGDQATLYNNFVFGAELLIPLTERLAIFGQGNFITPPDSGTVDSYLGFVYYPGGGSRHAYRSAFKPVQTVAAPTNFGVNLRRR
jgi:hypothetical protein